MGGISYRNTMIECGIDALLAGNTSTEIALLASGDEYNSDREILNLFADSAKTIGLALPSEEDKTLWFSKTILELKKHGVEIPQNYYSSAVIENINVMYSQLVKCTKREKSIINFCHIFGKYLGYTGDIYDYETWLYDLRINIQRIHNLFLKKHAERIYRFISTFPRGFAEDCHVKESYKIISEFLLWENTNKSSY